MCASRSRGGEEKGARKARREMRRGGKGGRGRGWGGGVGWWHLSEMQIQHWPPPTKTDACLIDNLSAKIPQSSRLQ